MRLRPYAAAPRRRGAQVLADLLVLLWIVVWIGVGRRVRSAVDSLAAPGERLHEGAGGLSDSLGRAARDAGGVPFVGRTLSSPLRGASSSAQSLAEAGTRLVDAVHTLADLLAVTVALTPILLVVLAWLPLRLRFAVRAGGAGAALGRLEPGAATRLLAVRALTTVPLPALSRVSADPVADVAVADPAVLERLAALERRRLGLGR